DARLIDLMGPRLAEITGAALDDAGRERLEKGLAGLKTRAQTLLELADKAAFYVRPRPLVPTEKAARLLASGGDHLRAVASILADVAPWQSEPLETAVRGYVEGAGAKLGEVAQPLRAALTGSTESPGLFEVLEVLGRDESLARISDALT
ncbi:MAG: glutamate--tRNA ligase, partial [Rhodospirillales bacterium]|nr:glutamate--tRNA ligase [Rhodospirillales bacterium]